MQQSLSRGNGERQLLHVCHFPPGTSKWNKIEHRMFCHITQNWRGQPLVSHDVIIALIAHTTTRAGLKIRAALDPASYPTGTKISDEGAERRVDGLDEESELKRGFHDGARR